MHCINCGNENVEVKIINTHAKTSHTSLFRVIGRILLILMTCGLWIFVPKKKESVQNYFQKMLVCNSCGHTENLNSKKRK